MKTEQAVAPSLDEFQSACATAFSFLITQYGFRRVRPNNSKYQNPFEAHFEKNGWRIIACGLSYGFSLDLEIRSPDGRVASFGHFVPADTRTSIRQDFPRGQLGEISSAARLLREFGSEMLGGDWQKFEEIERAQSERRANQRDAWEKLEAAARLGRALEIADSAFRLRKYGEVVRELTPLTGLLSATQRKKLDIAIKRLT